MFNSYKIFEEILSKEHNVFKVLKILKDSENFNRLPNICGAENGMIYFNLDREDLDKLTLDELIELRHNGCYYDEKNDSLVMDV